MDSLTQTRWSRPVRELKAQLWSALLVIFTVGAVVSAGINFQQQAGFWLPDDGVTWVERGERVEALYIVPDSPADKAGLRTGDRVLTVSGVPVEKATDVTRVLVHLGSWRKAEYEIQRSGVEVKVPVIVGERGADKSLFYQYVVGLAYLVLGLFVYVRRGGAEKATHFYLLCLVSFVFSTFHYTGKLNNFDKFMYWGNVIAGLFAPTIFLHFCLTFPKAGRSFRGAIRAMLLYVPAILLMLVFFGVGSGTLRVAIPLVELRWLLDRFWLAFLSVFYMAGAAVLHLQWRREGDPILRQQLKWLRNGAVFGVVPFVAFYAVPFIVGVVPGEWMKMSVLTLAIMPLAWSYAVLRYRLMDVDIIFQQGYAYTLATLCILGLFYGLILSLGKFEDISPTATVLLILIAAFVFQPIRAWIKDQLDRYYFYRDRYDYRRTWIEFARELSSETDMGRMLTSVADRLQRTLSVDKVAFFLSDEAERGFALHMAAVLPGSDPIEPEKLDLSFLNSNPDKPYLFFERTKHPLDIVSRQWAPSVRRSIADLDLTYYLPCSVRGKTIAWLGVGRTDKGDFLTSDDLELLVTLAGYVGIAVENSRLYSSLQRKVEENERLREFNENIVESIKVGILAVDLDDRVESWNTEMEGLTGISREVATGQLLSALLPSDLTAQFDRVREETGLYHLTKVAFRTGLVNETPVAAGGMDSNGSNGGDGVSGHGNSADAEKELTLNVAIAPLISRDGQRIGRLILFDDVTERAELERRLVQADKLSSIGLLAAGVAHEVNTPLAVISTYAQMLAKQIAGDEEKSVLLDKIARQTFRANEIVNSLLNFSRTSPTEFVETDLARVLRETLTLVQHQFEKSGIKVRMNLEESLPLIRGNPGRLQQVFLNLYLNARDAMDRGGTLTVSAWGSENGAEVEVSDTGKGIAPEHVQRIYDPFFTTKNSAAQKGTGLGLSITYGIVREHGGVIEVDSRLGEGSRFRLEFPAVRKAVNA
ncbi:MAG: ATP-binding protein [Bryobacteraceae bacterium]